MAAIPFTREGIRCVAWHGLTKRKSLSDCVSNDMLDDLMVIQGFTALFCTAQ
jgi:hypothetical protein